MLDVEELYVLASSITTYRGVPFHVVNKRKMTDSEAGMLEGVWEKLVAARDLLVSKEAGPQETGLGLSARIEFSEDEVVLVKEVVRAVLKEHECDEYSLRVHVADRAKVEAALARL